MPIGPSITTGLLYPGQCVTLSVAGNAVTPAPYVDGPYYVGAIVDPQNVFIEFFEDNNTGSYRIGVGARPDLVITSLTGPTSVRPGEQLTAQARVCNHGTEMGEAPLELFLSADTALQLSSQTPTGDTYLGMASTGLLLPGQCNTVSIPGNAYPPYPFVEGPYYLGAVVGAQVQHYELIADNNAAFHRLGVGAGPDFVVESVTGPASFQPGQAITAQVRVCNAGTDPDDADVGLYLSADAILQPFTYTPTGDSTVGMAPTGMLYPGQCTTVSIPGNAYPPHPFQEGAFYLGAVVDPFNVREELLKDNNANAGSRVGVGSRPDFVVTTVTGPASVQPGASFTASASICNRGQAGDSTEVALYLSADATLRPRDPRNPGAFVEDFFLGTLPTGTLAPGACATRTLTVTAPSVQDGAYFLGGVVDPEGLREELIEDNNVTVSNRIGLGFRADFVVNTVSGPTSVQPNATFTTSVNLCNRGQSSATADVDVYLSADTHIQRAPPSGPSEDFLLGTIPGVSLAMGQCVTRSLSVTAPYLPPELHGAYYLGAVVDPRNLREELIEDNNVKVGSRIGVGYEADFVITSVSGPASIRSGVAFTASVRICNQGQAFGDADVELYLSADTLIRANNPSRPSEDFFLGVIQGVLLNRGQCITRSLVVNANAPTGSYYLGAVVDPQNTRSEFFEDNNTFAGQYLSLTP
jgi:subtilase family serine protease